MASEVGQNWMRLVTKPYSHQITRWPQAGRHLLAQYDDQTVIV
ncbi:MULTISPECIES: hypothetical protein [unclassified Nostoc]|nr:MULTISPECIES: hypothetical protein [unclassified Nostoc]